MNKLGLVLVLVLTLAAFMLAGVFQALQGTELPYSLIAPSGIAVILLPPLIVLVTRHSRSQRKVIIMCLIFAVVGAGILVVAAFLGNESDVFTALLGVLLPSLIAWSFSMLMLNRSFRTARQEP